MPTLAEVQAQLTGPGGAFEVVTETVNGVEMKVYKDRMKSLRQVAELAAMRGDAQPFLVYGDRRWGFAQFVAEANSVSNTLKEWGVQRGDRVAVLSGGTITHVGTHAQLLAEVPEYRDLLSADAAEVAA